MTNPESISIVTSVKTFQIYA